MNRLFTDFGRSLDHLGTSRLITNDASNIELLHVQSNGYVGIGTATPVEKLDVRGGLIINGGLSIAVGSGQPSGGQLRYGSCRIPPSSCRSIGRMVPVRIST